MGSSSIHELQKKILGENVIPLPIDTKKPTEVLDCDLPTGDNHVPRDSRLIRLTGIHPFNSEPPLTELYNSGFITPTELCLVRNHGAVPKVLDEEINNWTFTIEGLVTNPMTIAFHELRKFRQITIPITLVCCGNRRKEQNTVCKGKGFNWGSAAACTALFTGVYLHEILEKAKPKMEGKYLCMEGADQLPNGVYGTSIRLSTAMNPTKKVMLAHKMNGEMLTPDHGRPLRVIIPGHIGGRSVKWLKRLIITEKPSENWYHIYDNRVLPNMLTVEMVDRDHRWWHDERYALYNLNVQSVICFPAHDERICINDQEVYSVRGYAYNGGGIRIGRVEISLDQGFTWKLAVIDYPEDQYRQVADGLVVYDGILDTLNDESCFCWCFWKVDVRMEELFQANDIVVRAMDEGMNTQPRDMYWNVLSMLNNCWHRVTITKEDNDTILKVDHPTVAGVNPGGWMEKVKTEGRNLTDGFWGSSSVVKAKPTIDVNMIDHSVKKVITDDELAKHNQDGDTWLAINGHVYDVSEYLNEHPGGRDSIVLASGGDATEDFLAIHSNIAKAMMKKYHIGILQQSTVIRTNTEIDGSSDVFLKRKHWSKAVLKTKKRFNKDTFHLVFELEHPHQKLGVPIGKHLYLQCISPSGEKIVRSYSPISDVEQRGYFEMIIKVYMPSESQSAGKMSDCIERLQEGDFAQFKGPFGDLEYQRNKIFTIKGVAQKVERLTMIAGGSGITPIYQVLRYAHADGIQCHIVYCNKTANDILLKCELESFQKINHCLSRANENWTGYRGHISKEMIGEKHDGLLLCCGPPQMEKLVRSIAEQTGWDVNKQFIVF